MENEQEKKYFIIWLYISILLHLLVVIIMLSIKPATSPSKEPDPASGDFASTQVLFFQDEPEIIPAHDEPIQQEIQMAKRDQGGSVDLQHSQTNPKDAQLDIPTPALSDEYKKAMHNETKITDQDNEGRVNILEDAIIDQIEQLEKQVLETTPKNFRPDEDLKISTNNNLTEITKIIESQKRQPTPGERLQSVIHEKMQKSTDKNIASHEFEKEKPIQEQIQKIISKKHRPADLGQENLSKIQLSKQMQDMPAPKKKISLQDIQSGFSQFIKNGNEQYFSSSGNAQQDDITGLKLASYMRQIGQMYHQAHDIATKPILTGKNSPAADSVILITIHRSGKFDCQLTASCGMDQIDNFHINYVRSIGTFPPVPKFIEAPLQIPATLMFTSHQSSMIRFNTTNKR